MTPHATAPAASVDGGNATGVPDASRAAEKHKKQRDEVRTQLALSSSTTALSCSEDSTKLKNYC